jgi:hypothetical protein
MIDFGRKYIEVGAYKGYTHIVSEGRAEALGVLLGEIATEQAKYDSFAKIPRKVLGDLRRRKAEMLIEFETRPPDSFFEGKDYPVSVVEDALALFTNYVGSI